MNERVGGWVVTPAALSSFVSVSSVSRDLQSQAQRIYSNKHTHWIEWIYGVWPHQFSYFSLPRKTNYVPHYQSVWEQSAAAVSDTSRGYNASVSSCFSLVRSFWVTMLIVALLREEVCEARCKPSLEEMSSFCSLTFPNPHGLMMLCLGVVIFLLKTCTLCLKMYIFLIRNTSTASPEIQWWWKESHLGTDGL